MVVVETRGAEGVFALVSRQLALNGYVVAESNMDAGSILTEGFVMENSEVRLSVNVSDSLVVVIPDVRLSAQGAVAMNALVGSYNNQWVRANWGEEDAQFSKAVEFALSLGLGAVSYREPGATP